MSTETRDISRGEWIESPKPENLNPPRRPNSNSTSAATLQTRGMCVCVCARGSDGRRPAPRLAERRRTPDAVVTHSRCSHDATCVARTTDNYTTNSTSTGKYRPSTTPTVCKGRCRPHQRHLQRNRCGECHFRPLSAPASKSLTLGKVHYRQDRAWMRQQGLSSL